MNLEISSDGYMGIFASLIVCALVAAGLWLFARLSAKKRKANGVADWDAMTPAAKRAADWEALNLEQRQEVKAEEDFIREVKDGYYSERYLQAIDSLDRFRGLHLRSRVKKALAEIEAARTSSK